ncbi:MAG: hypothetical protein MR364_05970 [Oscillospiraceae bacterium]|nr:hypothetical protein [Oscillospiraceae bacterium]
MKKIIAVLLTVVMAFCLTACGKETGVDVTGKYTCIGEHYGDTGYQTPMQNVIIELKKGGKGTYSGGFDYEMTWKLDGEKFSGKVTFLGLENAMEGTLKDGVLEVVYGDAHMLFLKEGAKAPDIPIGGDSDTDSELDTDSSDDVSSENATESSAQSNVTSTADSNVSSVETDSTAIATSSDNEESSSAVELSSNSEPQETGSTANKAAQFDGDWYGIAEFGGCTGVYEDSNGGQCEIIARFICNDNGSLTPYIAISLSGIGFQDLTAEIFENDNAPMILLNGTLNGYNIAGSYIELVGDLMQVGIVSKDNEGNSFTFAANLRRFGDYNWDSDNYPRPTKESIDYYNGKSLEDIAQVLGLDISEIPTR